MSNTFSDSTTINSNSSTTFAPNVFVAGGEGRTVDLGDHRGSIKVSSRDSDGAFLLADVQVDPMGGPPPHVHTLEDETFFIMEGQFRCCIGDRMIEAVAGDTIFAPRNVPHGWNCISPDGGRLLLLVTPAENFETFMTSLDGQVTFPPDAAMIERLASTARAHGIEMLPPA